MYTYNIWYVHMNTHICGFFVHMHLLYPRAIWLVLIDEGSQVFEHDGHGEACLLIETARVTLVDFLTSRIFGRVSGKILQTKHTKKAFDKRFFFTFF